MSSIKTLNGVQYTLPGYNDTGWGANTGNVLTQYLSAIADVTLQLSGGSFTLTADVDFGANFGLKALFLKTETANPASAGVVRLAKTDSIKWRNNANGADIALAIDGSDNLTYAATKVLLSGAVVNADINASAAIAYSKLALTGSIVNADVNASAAIAYSKLALTGSIVNGDLTAGTLTNTAINASAAIALSKLAALGTAKALQSNSSTGFIEVSAVTNTELGYLSGVTSAIQTQINGKQASGTYIANPLIADLAAGSHKITGLAAGSVNGDALRYEQRTRTFAGSFTSAAGTGNQAVTGVGFTPKLVMFYMAISNSGNLDITHGRMDDAGHQSVEMTAVGPSAAVLTVNTTACVGLTGISSASYVSMDADGFTINWASANAQTIHYVAIG